MENGIITGERHLSIDKWAKRNGISPHLASHLVKSLRDPEEMPYLLQRILDECPGLRGRGKKEVRNALLRVQTYCSINTNSDPIKVSKQLFIAQVLEKLLFGCNMLLSDEIEVEEKPARKRKGAAKAKK